MTQMPSNTDSSKPLSDDAATVLLRLAIEAEDPIGDMIAMADLPSRELWADIKERWQCLGRPITDASVANLLGEPEHRAKRWRRQRNLLLPVRRRLAALSELLFLLESRRIKSIGETELLAVISTLRGASAAVDEATALEVLGAFEPQPEKPSSSVGI
jgi:hypothetical protein